MAKADRNHRRIKAAGWCYCRNERGWVIYLNPQTGRWHTAAEALAIIEAGTWPQAA